jgi:16S rRNA processing protein RimM
MARRKGDDTVAGASAPGREFRMVLLGRVVGVHGLHGWVKIFSATEPRENILTYSPWYLGRSREPVEVADGRLHGKGLVARLEDCADRDHAADLVGLEISISREQLPPPSADEFYWTDLEGLAVQTLDGEPLGRVDHLFSTAGNDVLVVQGARDRLVPFVWDDVVKEVDFDRGLIRIDWDPEF